MKSGISDRSDRAWDIDTGQTRATLKSGTSDRRDRVWNIDTSQIRATIKSVTSDMSHAMTYENVFDRISLGTPWCCTLIQAAVIAIIMIHFTATTDCQCPIGI